VFLDVYLLNSGGGSDDPVAALNRGPTRGELIIRPENGHLVAQIRDPTTGEDLLRRLIYVQLRGVSSKGMLLEGTVTVSERVSPKSKTNSHKERWLVKLPGSKAILDTEKLLARSAANLRRKNLFGFNPDDDDRID
jgi:hypothetical protein